MTTFVIGVVVSPTGQLHGFRIGQDRTVCGVNWRRKRYVRGYATGRGWTVMPKGFDATGRLCRNCHDNLVAGYGPGA